MLQQTFAVFLVLALLLAALWLLRRQGLASYGFFSISRGTAGRNRDRHLRAIERLPLTPQHSLHLISIGDQLVLFATSPAGCQRVEPVSPVHSADGDRPASLRTGASC